MNCNAICAMHMVFVKLKSEGFTCSNDAKDIRQFNYAFVKLFHSFIVFCEQLQRRRMMRCCENKYNIFYKS